MAVLKYVTRGEQTAQGKQKAYFCAHPDDYERYFEKITNEVLDTLAKENNRNCAFFYLEDATAERDEDFRFSFKEMNLIVMPVTTRLLTAKNPALDVEFKLAAEYGIPVLPIMMESGLEDVFNAKCGDIQFLDPNSRDATAISYEEKLTKYLTSVLIGDELAEKIRKAFDAYIFLSYRKKDRQYAQELMRLIHKNEFCRDIAIWYDEFLTPGENFNKSIEDALKKSKLFALAVTPSLLEKSRDKDGNECENYIVTTEYPMARTRAENDKDFRILPAELVKTDKNALDEKYEGIPVCVRADDNATLSVALENALEGIALRENDNDPEHNFFIGLAYLSGIDVERDNDRALSLITSAADAELPEAMKKLVSIYRNGDTGEKDYKKAIEWQRKLVAYRKKVYDEKQDEDSAFDYLHDIWDLGDYIYELRQIDDAEAVYKEMLAASEEINNKFEKNWTLRRLSVSYNNLGDIYQSRGKLDDAEEYYRKSLGIREKLANETKTVESLRDLSVSYGRLGSIYESRGKLDDAEEYYRKKFDIAEKLASEMGTVESLRDLSISYERLGNIYKSRGKLDDAEEYYRKELGIDEKLANETGTVESLRGLSVSYNHLGNISHSRDELDDAEKYYRQSRDKLDDAEKYYRQSLDIAEKLANETGTVESLHDLSVIYNNLGNISHSRDKLDDAEKYYRQSLDIAEKLANETGTVESLRGLSISYNNLGSICKSRGKIEDAMGYFLKSLDIFQKLSSEMGIFTDLLNLSLTYHNLGFVYERQDEFEDADKYYRKSLDIRKKIADETGTVEARRNLSSYYITLGNTNLVREDYEVADMYYLQALEIRDNLVCETKNSEQMRDLLDSYQCFTRTKCSRIDPILGFFGETASDIWESEIDVDKTFSFEAGTIEFDNNLAAIYFNLSIVLPDPQKKIEYREKALAIWAKLANMNPNVPEYAQKRDLVKRELGIQ